MGGPKRRPFQYFAKYTEAQTNTELVAAPGNGGHIAVTDVRFENGEDDIGYMSLLNGSGGTVLLGRFVNTSSENPHPSSAKKGGVRGEAHDPLRLTPGTALCFTSTDVVNHAILVLGYVQG